MNIEQLGWNSDFSKHFTKYENDGFFPARITCQYKNGYDVLTESGEYKAELSGRFLHSATYRSDFPAVGDWTAVSVYPGEKRVIIHRLLPRQSVFSRKAASSGGMPESGGRTDEQILAANIDTVFLVVGLDGDYNMRRIERYLTATWDCGASPVMVLNKTDICDNLAERIDEISTIAIDVPICPVSAAENTGIDELREHVQGGMTVVFLGSSGVGKSTIINCLLGEDRLRTGEVRVYDSRGRHTTTHRELILLPDGGVVIDTPGMRELQLWGNEDGLKTTFDDIEMLAEQCRFRDCSHQGEPGCAIQEAIENGTLDKKRYKNYRKMQQELLHQKRRQDNNAARIERDKWKKIAKSRRKLNKHT